MGVAACFLESSVGLGVEGRSSDLRELKACVMIREINLVRDGGDVTGRGGSGGGVGVAKSVPLPTELVIDGGMELAGRTVASEGEV